MIRNIRLDAMEMTCIEAGKRFVEEKRVRANIVVSMIQFKHVVREKQEVIWKLTKKLFIKQESNICIILLSYC